MLDMKRLRNDLEGVKNALESRGGKFTELDQFFSA